MCVRIIGYRMILFYNTTRPLEEVHFYSSYEGHTLDTMFEQN